MTGIPLLPEGDAAKQTGCEVEGPRTRWPPAPIRRCYAIGLTVDPVLLAKAGGCGTHAPSTFLRACSTRTDPANGQVI
jgi:hypothetical protein